MRRHIYIKRNLTIIEIIEESVKTKKNSSKCVRVCKLCWSRLTADRLQATHGVQSLLLSILVCLVSVTVGNVTSFNKNFGTCVAEYAK